MEIIDLLNKIANGEEAPEKIKINNIIYEYQGDDYLFKDKNNNNHEYWLFSNGYTDKFQWLDSFLKTEVEILEEKKIPEKLGKIDDNDGYIDQNDVIRIARKVDEIIDYLKKEEKIPEKIDNWTSAVGRVDDSNIEEYVHKLFEQQTILYFKTNSIIDYLKRKGE